MPKSSRTVYSVRNLVTSFLSQGLSVILKFVTRTVFIHTLGKSYLGINGLFADILTMLSLAELGLDTAITYRLYKPLADKDNDRLRVLMKFYRYAYFIIGLAIIVFGLVLIPFLPFLVKDYDSLLGLNLNPVIIFLLYLFNSASSYLFFAYKGAIIRAAQKNYIVTVVTMITSIILQLVQIAVLILFNDFTLYVVVAIVFSVITNFVNSVIAKKMYPDVFTRTSDKLDTKEIKDIFKDLGAVFVSKVNSVVLKATDNIVLSAFIGIDYVGLYSNYLMIYTAIRSFLISIYTATKASMGDLFAKSDVETKHNFFNLMNYITIILYGTSAVCVAVVTNEFINVWVGEEYLIAMPFPVLVGIEILFMGFKQNLNQIRNISGLFRQMWMRPLIGTIINLGVSIALVNFIGIFGVIIGTISADLLANFLIDPKIIYKNGFEGKYKVSEYYKHNVRYMIELTLIGILDYLFCSYVCVGMGWLSVILHGFVCMVSVPLYMLLVYKNSDEAKYIFSKIKNILKKRTAKNA